MEDELKEIQCFSIESIANLIRGTKPEYLLQADDPKVLKIGWSTGKYWYTISLKNLEQETKGNTLLASVLSTEEGRRSIRDLLYSISRQEKKQI